MTNHLDIQEDSWFFIEASAQTSFPQLGRNNRIGINIGIER